MSKPSPASAESEILEKILVVDDDEDILKQMKWALSDSHRVFTATEREEAVRLIRDEEIPVCLLDLGLPPHPREATEGLRALEEVLEVDPLCKVVIISGNRERQNALRAVEKGAHDIFPKPVDVDELKVVLKRVYGRVALEKDSLARSGGSRSLSFEDIVGSSPKMEKVFVSIRRVAPTEVPVLVTGESGTGKELVARAIHGRSERRSGPLVVINCATIPENLLESELFGHEKGAFTGATTARKGKVEFAAGGTLFLDEISEMTPALQVKLLRFLQEKVIERVGGKDVLPVDCRLIASSNRDLREMVREKHFREDLYFRLAVFHVVLPPLRERGDDVVELAEHFIAVHSKEAGCPPKALSKTVVEFLRAHAWPGNVRELQNRVRRALVVAQGNFIQPGDLELDDKEPRVSGATLKEARSQLE
ncbi:MAG: sigma 54-interacting transcriptional regulator, partial [Planctomycetota bacterium]|nr:sigma 54-interacting transcriptional regulator [Planctomycetota bacterium]